MNRRSNLKHGMLLAFGLLWCMAASAQDSLHMNLEQVLQVALAESPTIKIANRDITVKQAYEKEQWASLFPSVALTGSYGRTLKKQVMAMSMNGQTTKIAVGTDNSWQGGVTLSLPLVAPALWKTIELSQQDVELAVESARSSKISLISQVKKAYYTVLLAQDSYRVLRQSYSSAEMNAANVRDKFNQGLVSEFDRLRADVQVKNMQPNVVAAESGLRLATMQLKVLMGLDVNEPVVFDGSLEDYEQQMLASSELLHQEASLTDNSSLKQLDLQQQQLETSIKLLKSAYMPTLSLSANYLYTALNDDFKFSHYNWNPYSMLSLSLNIPIYSGGAKLQKVKQQQITLQNIADTRTNLERSLQLSIDNSLDNMQKAVENLASNKETVTMAEKAYAISQKQYEVGMNTLIEMNDAELALTQSRLAYTQSIYEYMDALADLENVLGTTVVNE